MNTMLPMLCVVMLASQPGDGVKPAVPPAAKVLIVDQVGGFSLGDKVVELRLQPPPKGDILKDAIQVEVPLDLVPKDPGGKPQFLGRQVVAVQGQLTLGKVAVGHTGSVPAKVIYAANLRLVAAKVEVVGDKEMKPLPAPGKTEVRGKLLAGKFPVKDGEVALWAVENGNLPILLVGKGAEQAQNLSGAVVVTGRLRLVRPMNVTILEVDTVVAEMPGGKL